MQILIAEDDATARLILEKTVTTLGHQCVVAQNGVEAWAIVQHTHVDVVITDWMMPGIDGVELCQRIRARAEATLRTLSCSRRSTARWRRRMRRSLQRHGTKKRLFTPYHTIYTPRWCRYKG